MIAGRRKITDEDLDHFVDGRLDPERRAEVAAYLAEHPEVAEEIEAYGRLNALLCDQFEAVLEEPVPARLLRTAARGRVASRTGLKRVLRVAATVVLSAAVGGIGGWLWREATIEPPAGSDFARQAASAHRVYAPELQRPVEITAEQEPQLLAWLSRRVGARIEAPRLADVGYRLIGGRLLPTAEGAAAQFMYENAAGTRITLYLRTDLRNTRDIEFQIARERDVNVWYWLEGPRGYALSGELDQRELLKIAEVLYDELGS